MPVLNFKSDSSGGIGKDINNIYGQRLLSLQPFGPRYLGRFFVSIPKNAEMKKKLTFKGLWGVLKDSFGGFSEDKVTKLSASLAYYTVFSMGLLLIVIIFLCSMFLDREAV